MPIIYLLFFDYAARGFFIHDKDSFIIVNTSLKWNFCVQYQLAIVTN